MTSFKETVPPLDRFSSLIVAVTPGLSPSAVAIPAGAGAAGAAEAGAEVTGVDGESAADDAVGAAADGIGAGLVSFLAHEASVAKSRTGTRMEARKGRLGMSMDHLCPTILRSSSSEDNARLPP
jgi:hypothetical protein